MPRFIVIHGGAPSMASQDEVVERVKQVVASQPPGTKWLNSWVLPKEWKLICEWDAPDAEAVRAALAAQEDFLPIEAIYEAEPIDPKWFE